jgi:hypothetical protein
MPDKQRFAWVPKRGLGTGKRGVRIPREEGSEGRASKLSLIAEKKAGNSLYSWML